MFERVVVPDLQQAIQQQIKRYILDKGLREGDRLPTEEELAHQLGTSRTAIREALSGLEALGLIEVRHGSGRYVRPFNFSAILDNLAYSMLFDVHSFEEILDVRVELELAFLPRALATLNDDDLRMLRTILERMEQRGANGTFDEAMVEDDIVFHRTIYQRIGNDLLLKLLDVFWTVHKQLRSRFPYETQDVSRYLQQHRALYEAIAQRDIGLARQRLNDQFEGVRTWVAQTRGGRE